MLFSVNFRSNMMSNVWETERKEIATWLSGYLAMIKKWVDGEEIPKPPTPKSPAPPLPQNFDDEKQIDKFKKDYNKWKKENNHLPNLQTAEQIVERFKQQWEARKKQQQSLDGRVTSIEQKLDKLMNHLGVK